MIKKKDVEKITKILKKKLYDDGEKAKVKKADIKRRYLHSLRVAHNCLILGKSLDLSNNDLNILLLAGLLHDISKFEEKFKNEKRNHAELAKYHIFNILKNYEISLDDSYDIISVIEDHSNKKDYEFENIRKLKTILVLYKYKDNITNEEIFLFKRMARLKILKSILKEADIIDHTDINYVSKKCGDDLDALEKLINELEEFNHKEKFSIKGKELMNQGMNSLYDIRQKMIIIKQANNNPFNQMLLCATMKKLKNKKLKRSSAIEFPIKKLNYDNILF